MSVRQRIDFVMVIWIFGVLVAAYVLSFAISCVQSLTLNSTNAFAVASGQIFVRPQLRSGVHILIIPVRPQLDTQPTWQDSLGYDLLIFQLVVSSTDLPRPACYSPESLPLPSLRRYLIVSLRVI